MAPFFDESTMMQNRAAENLIDDLYGPHLDNVAYQYYARDIRSGIRTHSMMPHTSFVYEFFLFNSLYQVDWSSSHRSVIYHSREDCGESKMQRKFISFLKERSADYPQYIYRAFFPLIYFETAGEWTSVVPDSRIDEEKGDNFFKNINLLKSLLESCKTPSEMPTSNKTFDILQKCTYFIYLVRNNIFHGAKKLGDIYEPNQRRRIEIYDTFLKGINSLFFLLSGRKKAACDYIPCPLHISSEIVREIMNKEDILTAIARGMMKTADSQLIMQFFKQVNKQKTTKYLSKRSSLFYPSASRDFITPILLGLPYCTQFYFFEISRINPRRQHIPDSILNLRNILWKIIGAKRPVELVYSAHDNVDCLDFEYDGLPRRIHWVHEDNTEIFNKDVELQFYFHRGDSWGEGGSGQQWDSKYLPELQKLIPSGSFAFYVTDGVPGGFQSECATETFDITVPFIDRNRTYYCGKLLSLQRG